MYTKILVNTLKYKIRVAAVDSSWVQTSIVERNIDNEPLTPKQSAKHMYRFIDSDLKTGILWVMKWNSTSMVKQLLVKHQHISNL